MAQNQRMVHVLSRSSGASDRRPNLNRQQLHDGLQLAGGVLPDHMLDPRHPAEGAATVSGNANKSTACQLNWSGRVCVVGKPSLQLS
jgi:hypothetical protein